MNYRSFARANSRFLLFGFALTFFSSFGQTFFIGVFGGDIRETFDLGEGAFGTLYSLATLTSGFCVMWLGRQIDRVELRLYCTAVCAGMVVATFCMARVETAFLLTVALFGVRLFGQGLMSHTAITSMARYFDAHRGKAMSIAGLGFAAGEAVFPRAAVAVRDAYGWRETWLLVAAVLLVVTVPLALVLLRGHGARHRELLARTLETPSGSTSTDGASRRDGRSSGQWSRRQVLRDPRFYLILPSILAPAFIVTGLFFHQSTLVEAKGWTAAWFTSGFIVFAAAQVPSSLLAGPLVDRLGGMRLLPALLAPLGVALLVLASADHPAVAMLFMAIAGITSGVIGPIVGAVWAELYGVLHMGAIRAMVTSLMVCSTAGSPITMGWLIDAGVTIDAIARMCVACCAVATVLVVVARIREKAALRPLEGR